MFLNLETDYAIRIVGCLAVQDSIIDAKTISEHTGVTLRFSLKILNRLVQAGIAKSFKGAKGGYMLAKPPEEISLLTVIEEVCGPVEFSQCQGDHANCTHPQGLCRFRGVFDDASAYARQKFASVTFKSCGKE